MKKIDNLEAGFYDVGDGFIVEIVEDKQHDHRQIWLYHEDCRCKMYVYGFFEDLEWAKEVTESEIGEYIEQYKKLFMEEE
jgi:hypothetical protein